MIERPMPLFPMEEYRARWTRLDTAMDSAGLDVLLVSDPANMAYLSGYIGDSSYLPQMLIHQRGGDQPWLVLRRMDGPVALVTTHLDRTHIITYPEALVGNSEGDGHDFILDLMEDQGWRSAAIGLEQDSISHLAYRKFAARLSIPPADASGLVMQLRVIKSAREIAVMRDASQVTDAAVRTAITAARPGRRECEIAADILHTLAGGVPHVDTIQVMLPNISSGQRIGTAHFKWYEGRVDAGSQLNFEIAGSRNLYMVPLMRTISLGPPADRLASLHDGVLEGLNAALEVVRPGATCGEVAEAFHRALNRHGYHKDSRCGYSIGLNLPEPALSIQPDNQDILAENMTLHLMLGTWIEEDFGVTLSESFIVTSDGCEVFSSIERQLLCA